ncbi:MAG: glycoside hydrolase family 31 protein [Eubacteriales bacterium]|nr:glycoside hydrolase family 31 protein [Eubacteriales bacterium]
MIQTKEGKLIRRYDKELLLIEPWGENSLRVRATQRSEFLTDGELTALLPRTQEQEEADARRVQIFGENDSTVIENGKIRCEVTPEGKLIFRRTGGEVLLEEYQRIRSHLGGSTKNFNSALEIEPRTFQPYEGMDNYKITVRFEASPDEKLFGMGQYQQPFLNLKGCILELAHRNSQASVPFVLSSRGYGLLWNSPAIGHVTYGKNHTEYVAESAKQVDYWITAEDTPAGIERAYADAVGKAPMMPEYGLGFWQCKLRYQTQEEILTVAREYKKRNIPVDVIVVDFFHWPHEGDWCFDEDYWPDPAGMVRELKEMGMHLMVSIWPTVDEESTSVRELTEMGGLIRSERGKRFGQLGNAAIIDVTNPQTRQYVWEKIRKNYYEKGIHVFWLDEAEPELTGYEFEHYRYYLGTDLEVGNIYPREYARMAYEGMTAQGQENIVNLLRCAWAGSQRYGALVWSGDIDSSFRSLGNQLRAGLGMGIAGIPWWTTDIGGFHGGNIYDPAFREVFVRWFEFGAFCPVMRLHGFREPFKEALGTTGGGKCISGAENEIWSYGEEIEEICTRYITLREKMRPYTRRLMEAAHEKGDPVMRPLFYDFPEDERAWEIDDEYMFGGDVLVAPILEAGVTQREVYLPAGEWKNLHDGTLVQGGQNVTAQAPIDVIPVFVRNGALD